MIFPIFPTTFLRFPKIFQNLPKARPTFPYIFHKFPKKIQSCFDHRPTNLSMVKGTKNVIKNHIFTCEDIIFSPHVRISICYHSYTTNFYVIKKNWFMLLAVRISSYGCTWEVWRALKKLELLLAAPCATLTLLSCSPNFPRASTTRYTHAKHEPILK